jgi:hypothetical protein
MLHVNGREPIYMEILILVCAMSVAAPDCQKATAQHVLYAPPSDGSMVVCAREGLMYASQSNLIKPGSYAKVYCTAGDRLKHKAEVQ